MNKARDVAVSADDAVVVSPADTAAQRRFKKTIILAVVGLLLVAGLVTFVGIRRHAAQVAKDKAAALQTDALRYEGAISASDDLRSEQRYDEATEPLLSYAVTALDSQRKAYSYAQVGAIYEVKHDNKQALQWYRKAEQTSRREELGIDQGIARTSQAAGDKPTALQYYKKVLVIMKAKYAAKQLAFGQDDIDSVQSTIDQLERQP